MSVETFPRSNRLSRRSDFRKTYDEGKKVAGRYLVLFVRPNDRGRVRLGVTVTKRLGTAVERNRLRRRVREIFRTDARAKLAENRWTSSDLVVNLRNGAAGVASKALSEDFAGIIRRLGVRAV